MKPPTIDSVTDIACPLCGGYVRWAEAGHVPGYRICDGEGHHFQAAGDPNDPKLIFIHNQHGF